MAFSRNRRYFLAAASGLMAGSIMPAFARTTRHHKNPPQTAPDSNTHRHHNCGESISQTNARILLRASALAHMLTRKGRDPAPVAAIARACMQVEEKYAEKYFDLMLMKAQLESTLGEHDKPLLNTADQEPGRARGMFQYMPSPFSTLFSWFGADFEDGIYAEPAAAIKFRENKDTYTDDPNLLEQILALRSDHYVAAFIKVQEINKDERPLLRTVLGREPTLTDYYVAHFLGLERAKTFFRLLRKTPKAPAANIFDVESSDPNNRPLFYKNGKKLTVRQVYDLLNNRVNHAISEINRQIREEMNRYECIQIIDTSDKPREKIIANAVAQPSTSSPPPEKPSEDQPIDPDALLYPAPLPAMPPPPPALVPDDYPTP